MAHRVIKKLKPFLKSKISYGARSNQKFLKSKVSYGAQSNKKIEAFLEIKFLMAHRVIKKKLLGKNKISYGAQSNRKYEALVKYLEKI